MTEQRLPRPQIHAVVEVIPPDDPRHPRNNPKHPLHEQWKRKTAEKATAHGIPHQ